ncbi:hypothetical protein SAR11G3_01231 [Candidatus Pelagibacter sp. IMCC9063]|nr:hypothetical protein SAR11G3_01231 [Candidatus Pelagibacter sp. IMCC9063]
MNTLSKPETAFSSADFKKLLYEDLWTSIRSGIFKMFSNLPKLFLIFFYP